MPAKLKDLTVAKVSLVPKGANPGANVALFKSDKGAPTSVDDAIDEIVRRVKKEVPTIDAKKIAGAITKATFNDVRHASQASTALWKIYDACYDMQDAIYSSMYDGKSEDIRKSAEQFKAYVENVMDDLAAGKFEKSDNAAARSEALAKAHKLLTERFEEEETTMKAKPVAKAKAEDSPKPFEDMTKEELIASAKATQALLSAAGTKSTAKTDPDDDDEDDEDEDDAIEKSELTEEMKKSLPAEALAVIQKAERTAKSALKLAKEAQAEAKVEKEKRELGEYITKARKILKHLPGTAEAHGQMLMDLYKTSPKEFADSIVEKLVIGDTALASVMRSSGAEDAVTGSALEQLNTVTEDIMKSEPNLTKPQAFDKACQQRKDLYKAYREERGRPQGE